jgi:hypothetical protein
MGTLLAIGDSVIWGQGLLEQHKTASLLARHLGVEVQMLAHSGAKIGIRDSYTVTMPSGEVPCFFPTILQQLQSFPGDPAQVKYVLMNGGINDVEVQRVFNPMIPQFELELHTRNYCGRDMFTLLQSVIRKFSNAQVLVLGYYPVLSQQSSPQGVEALFSLVHGVKFAPLYDPAAFRNELVEHCVRFWKLSTGLLRGAVEQVNRAARDARAIFVESGLDESNAAYTSRSLLWQMDLAHPGKAPDEVVAERSTACAQVASGEMQKHQCLLSSAGHPNVAGAAKMAAQCIVAHATAGIASVTSEI